jgi:hypothetical protein
MEEKEKGCIYCRRGDQCPDHDDNTCLYCGGEMSWCSVCRVWTSDCCQEYGTCECS